jgi:putative transcriptional regulator
MLYIGKDSYIITLLSSKGFYEYMREYITSQVYALRSEKGVTQEELAAVIGVSRQTIIAIEKGKYTPSVHLALKISMFFKTPLEKIFKINYEK